MPNDVFISYDAQDESFATQLKTHLTNAGITFADAGNVEAGVNVTAAVAESIQACKAFIPVLSPTAMQSTSIRKQLDMASRHDKPMVPLVWQKTDIPVAIEYQMAGVQWLDFAGDTSEAKFNELISALHKVIGGASLRDAMVNVSTTEEAPVPAIEDPAPPQKSGGLKLGGLKKKRTVSPRAIGGLVISRVVTTFELEANDQDLVSTELKWLFQAADHLVKVHRGEAQADSPVATSIPATAEQDPPADNKVLSSLDAFDIEMWAGQVESDFNRIQTYLRNLDILLKQEDQKGLAGKGDVYLQNQISASRLEIVKVLREMAQLMKQAYGVFVTSPIALVAALEG